MLVPTATASLPAVRSPKIEHDFFRRRWGQAVPKNATESGWHIAPFEHLGPLPPEAHTARCRQSSQRYWTLLVASLHYIARVARYCTYCKLLTSLHGLQAFGGMVQTCNVATTCGFHPGGMTAISRWLSAAIPPELRQTHHHGRPWRGRRVSRCDPSGVGKWPGTVGHCYRWCRCAQPPANSCGPSGVGHRMVTAPRPSLATIVTHSNPVFAKKVNRAAPEPRGQETVPQRGRCRNGERQTLPWDETYTPGKFGRLVIGYAVSGVAYWG